MNKREIVVISGELQTDALRILRGVPGLLVVGEESDGADRGVDAVISYGDSRMGVAVEFKQRANAANAWQLVHHADAHPDRTVLLVAGETTAQAREILEGHGVGVVDGLGNAHIELPGLLLHLEARRDRRRPAVAAPTRLRGKAGVVAQALLLEPERAWHVDELAARAEVSPALAHRVITRLEHEGLLTVEGAGPGRVRHLSDPRALLDLWAEENLDRTVRTPAYALASSPRQLIAQLGEGLEAAGIDHAITGAAAGSILAPFVTAVPVAQVWVSERVSGGDLAAAVSAKPVDDGENIVFLQARDNTPLAFRAKAGGVWTVNRFRLYVDLRGDPRRGREQAEHLREELIGF